MPLVIVFGIAIAFAVFMIYPVLSAGDDEKATLPVDVTPAEDLKRRRMVVYDNLQDLEFEYQAKKLASKDYLALRDAYKAEAARLMVASRDLERGTPEDRFIENEVAARRARLKSKVAEMYVCSKCGFNNPIPVKFCGNCGAPFPAPKL
ncbi:MAG: hypothetical protein ACRD3D_14360 [Terriglobia bacterium]